jgi:uncharacterized Zn finger protein (UPF0148 family)
MIHLDCPNCGEPVFKRKRNRFHEGEKEVCGNCGHLLEVEAEGGEAVIWDKGKP